MNKDLNRQAALEQAERQDFVPEKMLYCSGCGRTTIRTQRGSREDKIYCTCESYGQPMIPVVPNAPGGGGS